MNTHWRGPSDFGATYLKVVVQFERRSDGGLRAWSDQIPGLVLSHSNSQLVLEDVKGALEGLLSDQFGRQIIADRLDDLQMWIDSRVDDRASLETYPQVVEYVAHAA